MRAPAPSPCGSCPYRRDVPSGVWDADEYEKLPHYDGTTGEQAEAGALGVFHCHQQDGRVCAGWAGCHDMQENLGARLAVSVGLMAPEVYDELLAYETAVPLFESGAAAAEHGLAAIDAPGGDARRTITRLRRRLTLVDSKEPK